MEKDSFLQQLQQQLTRYYDEFKRLSQQRQSLDETIYQLEQCIGRVKSLQEAEQERLGVKTQVSPAIAVSKNRFDSMSISEALKILLPESSGNLDQLKERLRQGGFRFKENKSPRRQIHFALIKVPRAKRRVDGVWEYREE